MCEYVAYYMYVLIQSNVYIFTLSMEKRSRVHQSRGVQEAWFLFRCARSYGRVLRLNIFECDAVLCRTVSFLCKYLSCIIGENKNETVGLDNF